MAKTENDIKKNFYAVFAPDKGEQSPIIRKLSEQIAAVVQTFNGFVDVANVSTGDVSYIPKFVVIGPENADPGIAEEDNGLSVIGPVASYDGRGNGNTAGLIQKSGFASMATLTRGQTAVESFIATSVTHTVCSIPDYAIVKGVAVLVTATVSTAASFTVQSSGGTALSSTISTAQGTKSIARTNCPYQAGAAESLQLLFDTTPGDGNGRIEVVMFTEVISQS